jgi:hypothetical protein
MDDLRDRALRAARAAETPAARKRREAEATAETSRNAGLERLIGEANLICQREFGVRTYWRPCNNNRAVYTEIEHVRVEYHGHGRLSHTLASLGKELDRSGRHTCPNCSLRYIGEPKDHIKYVCRKPPFSARVGRLLRMIFPETLGGVDPAVRGGIDQW